jgi:hypothetical protein
MSVDVSNLNSGDRIRLAVHSSISTATYTGVVVGLDISYAAARVFKDVLSDHSKYIPDYGIKPDVETLEYILVKLDNDGIIPFAVEHLTQVVLLDVAVTTNLLLYDVPASQLTLIRQFLTSINVSYALVE